MAKRARKKEGSDRYPMGRRKSAIPHGASAAPPAVDHTHGGTKCGAKRKSGGHCAKPAGANTDHLGEGRCDLHGGKTPIKHGRYSKVKRKDLRELIQEFEQDPDPTNMLHELHLVRALARLFVDQKAADPVHQAKLVSEVTKIIERHERLQNANHITLTNLNRVMHEMGRVVDACVEDPAVRERIRNGWLNIRIV